jgi:DNA-binding NarL/FixJ family response regulator
MGDGVTPESSVTAPQHLTVARSEPTSGLTEALAEPAGAEPADSELADTQPAVDASEPAGPHDTQEVRVVFSPREKALVELLAAGHTDASAARRLGVSPRTVSYTLQSLMDRLEVENRFQLGLALGTLGTQEDDDRPSAPYAAQDRPPPSIGE